MPTFHDAKTGAAITVKVTPRAKKTEVAGVMEDGTIRIHVAAAPEDGAANRALIEFLSETLGIPASQIDIVAGMTGERKLISLIGITPAAVNDTMNSLAQTARARKGTGKLTDHRKRAAKK